MHLNHWPTDVKEKVGWTVTMPPKIVGPENRGHRIEINAVAADGRYNAEVRILRLFGRDKPHVETVTCFKLTAKHAEWSGETWARLWVYSRGGLG